MAPQAVALQDSLSLGFSRQEYRSGSPCPPPGDFPDPGTEPGSHVSCIGREILYHWCYLGSPLNVYDVLNTLVRAFSAVTYIFQAIRSPFYTEVRYQPVITQPGAVPQAFNRQTVFLIALLHRLQVVWKGMVHGGQRVQSNPI